MIHESSLVLPTDVREGQALDPTDQDPLAADRHHAPRQDVHLRRAPRRMATRSPSTSRSASNPTPNRTSTSSSASRKARARSSSTARPAVSSSSSVTEKIEMVIKVMEAPCSRPISKAPGWWTQNIRSPASGRRWRATMAAATSITPTANLGAAAGRGLQEAHRPRGNHPEPAGDRAQRPDLACDRQCHGQIAPDAVDCSEQGDAEQSAFFAALDCFAALAMAALIEYYPAPI